MRAFEFEGYRMATYIWDILSNLVSLRFTLEVLVYIYRRFGVIHSELYYVIDSLLFGELLVYVRFSYYYL